MWALLIWALTTLMPSEKEMAMATERRQFEMWADEADQRYGLPQGQMRRLITQESGWNPGAVSPVGARGLTQFMPATAREWGVDFNDPQNQIDRGGAYLAYLRDYFDGDMQKAVAAYNWGMGNVQRQGLGNMPRETRDYLQKVYGGDDMLTAPPAQAGPLTPEEEAAAMMSPIAPQPEMSPFPPDPQEQAMQAAMMQQQPMQMAMAPQQSMMGAPQPMQEPGRDWAGLGYGLAEILASANNQPRMAEVFRQRRIARGAENQRLTSALAQEYNMAVQQGYRGNILDYQREVAEMRRPPQAPKQRWRREVDAEGRVWRTDLNSGQIEPMTLPTGEQMTTDALGRREELEQRSRLQRETAREQRLDQQAIAGAESARAELVTIDSELQALMALRDEVNRTSVAGPADYATLKVRNPDLANRLEATFSGEGLRRLESLKGAASDKDIAFVMRGTPNLWAPGRGGEEAVRNFLDRAVQGLQRLQGQRQDEVERFNQRLSPDASEAPPPAATPAPAPAPAPMAPAPSAPPQNIGADQVIPPTQWDSQFDELQRQLDAM